MQIVLRLENTIFYEGICMMFTKCIHFHTSNRYAVCYIIGVCMYHIDVSIKKGGKKGICMQM